MTRRLNLLKIEDGLVYYTNEDNDCVLKEKPHELVTRGVVRLFDCKQDRDSIYAMTSMTKLDIKWYAFLTSLYLCTLLIAIPMSPYTVEIFGTFQPAGILIFPMTFIILDAINATLRYEYAKTTTYFGAGLCAISSGLIALTFYMFEIEGSYREVFYPLISLYLINSLCILSADQANNMIFKTLSSKLYRASIWQRSTISSIIGQALYTVIWIALFFNTSTSLTLLQKISDNYLFKIIYAILLIPLLYVFIFIYKCIRKRQEKFGTELHT